MTHTRRNIEDVILGLLLIAVGAIRVVIAITENEIWQFEPSIAFGLVVVGTYVLVRARAATNDGSAS